MAAAVRQAGPSLAQRVYPLTCEAEVVRVSAVGKGFNIAVHLLTPLFSNAA